MEMREYDILSPDHFICDIGNVCKLGIAEHVQVFRLVDIPKPVVILSVKYRHGNYPVLDAVVCLQDKVSLPFRGGKYNRPPVCRAVRVITDYNKNIAFRLFGGVVYCIYSGPVWITYDLGSEWIELRVCVIVLTTGRVVVVNGNDQFYVTASACNPLQAGIFALLRP